MCGVGIDVSCAVEKIAVLLYVVGLFSKYCCVYCGVVVMVVGVVGGW